MLHHLEARHLLLKGPLPLEVLSARTQRFVKHKLPCIRNHAYEKAHVVTRRTEAAHETTAGAGG